MTPSTAAQPTGSSIPDDILESIFLHLDDAADLVRTSAACTSFHRIIFNNSFLRRFRSLHLPPVIGFFDCSGGQKAFHPAQLPRRGAPAAHAFVGAADFTFSFLPDPKSWSVLDVHGGRVLLANTPTRGRFAPICFVVCDPLHRQYIQIPNIPDDMVTNLSERYGRFYFEPFLSRVDREEAETSLQLICNVWSRSIVSTFIFSLTTSEWKHVASFRADKRMSCPISLNRHYAHECFCWTEYGERIMCVLDTCKMKFSVVDLPSESSDRDKTVVKATKDRIGLLVLDECTLYRYSKSCLDIEDNAKEWRLDNTIYLSDCFWSFAKGASEDYVLLRGIPRDQYELWEQFPEMMADANYFTVETKTLFVESLCALKFNTSPDYLYVSFPPCFSPPSI